MTLEVTRDKHEIDCHSRANEWDRAEQERKLTGQDCFRKSHSRLFMKSKQELLKLVINSHVQYFTISFPFLLGHFMAISW
jgi:hypothetical protein